MKRKPKQTRPLAPDRTLISGLSPCPCGAKDLKGVIQKFGRCLDCVERDLNNQKPAAQAEFFAVKECDHSRPDHAPKTIYVNLDAILYVEDHGIEGEPLKIWCRGERGYYLVGESADRLIDQLKRRAAITD